jgi:hypothetical protein
MSNPTAEVAIFLAHSLAVIALVVLLAQSTSANGECNKSGGPGVTLRDRPSEDKSLDRYSH